MSNSRIEIKAHSNDCATVFVRHEHDDPKGCVGCFTGVDDWMFEGMTEVQLRAVAELFSRAADVVGDRKTLVQTSADLEVYLGWSDDSTPEGADNEQ